MIEKPYLLFLGGVTEQAFAKTAIGVAYWRPTWCVGQYRSDDKAVDIGLPDTTLVDAVAQGAKTLVIGVVNHGGYIEPEWLPIFKRALEAGLDIANGLHQRLNDLPDLKRCADARGRQLHDVRHYADTLPVGTGVPRSGRRVLTVGTDCSVGKMFTSLAIEKAMREKGLKADFCATGQTGILIAKSGIAVDAVASDFISGATEIISPATDPEHWSVVEGQGSLFHPSFAGVTLGLVHGAQAEALVLCDNPSRKTMMGLDGYRLPSLETCIAAYESASRLTMPDSKCVAVSLNTSAMAQDDAIRLVNDTEQRLGLPCFDPGRQDAAKAVDALLSL